MSVRLYDEVMQELQVALASSIRCGELTGLLGYLGFEVRKGSNGNHRIFTHDGITSFYSGSFDCGHGADPVVKVAYVRKIMRTIEKYELELKKYLGGDE